MLRLKANPRFIFAVLIFLLSSAFSFAQTAKDIFTTDTPVTWLGIDYTQARLIGDSMKDARGKFDAINTLTVNEAKKFDVQNALKKTSITNDLSFVKERNDKVDTVKFLSQSDADYTRLNESDIAKVVGSYNFKGKTGVGVVFITEGMNKRSAKSSMYVTFVDMKTSKVLYTERMEGKAAGFSVRNYWAKPIYEVISEIKNKKYEEWGKKF